MRAHATFFSVSVGALTAFATAQRSGEVDVDAILARLTLEQKLGQITLIPIGEPQNIPDKDRNSIVGNWQEAARTGRVGAMYGANTAAYTNEIQRAAFEESEHGIPLIIGNDIIHGYRTIFPIPLASSGSFDLELMQSLTRAAAVESRAAGTHWTFAPMVDIARDPRWGRASEGAGEDPWFGAKVAAARVKGFQGEGLDRPDAVAATAKHFAAYGAAVGGRDYDTTDMSEQTLREIHLRPFKAAVEAGTATLMTSFNDINGVPASGNSFLLQNILREEWNFDGFVTSDYTSINEMIPHGFARDLQHAGILALEAGCDVDLTGRVYQSQLTEAVEKGLISEATIDKSVRRVLEMKKRLGLFENPYGDEDTEAKVTLSDEHRALARKAAAESVVLLKNTDDLLPLDGTRGTIAVIGPLADSKRDSLGTWAGMGRAEDAVTALEGLQNAVDGARIVYAEGCKPDGDDRSGFQAAIALARSADVVLLFVGETEIMTGEANSRADLTLPGVQRELFEAIAETGTPVVAMLSTGRPIVVPEVEEKADAVMSVWHLGVEHGNGIADVVFGDVNPGAKLTMSWPRAIGQIPVYYARKNTGRPYRPNTRFVNRYRDMTMEPLYPFGYGLSYTTFELSGLDVASPEIGTRGVATVKATVTNTGDRAGSEVVQLYIHDRVATLVQPLRKLRGFEKVTLEAGESKEVTFELGTEELAIWNGEMDWVVEPGTFGVYVSTSSKGGLEGEFEVVERGTNGKMWGEN
ncbi:MAG: glycosyl hydrolase [Phycisphaerae bacterium]|nr:glycosyl hydrolase [Phycisphaerae bacterium]